MEKSTPPLLMLVDYLGIAIPTDKLIADPFLICLQNGGLQDDLLSVQTLLGQPPLLL